MSTLIEEAWKKLSALPPEQQDAIATRILGTLADEEAWERFFASKRSEFERMAAEALEEHRRGLTRPLDELLD